MNDSKNLILSAQNQDGDSLVMTLAPDTDISGLVDAFRTIAFWLTFSPTTIDENIPDGLREWSYDDEKVEPPAVSEEEIAELRKRDPMIEADERTADAERRGVLDHFNEMCPVKVSGDKGGCYECDKIRALLEAAEKADPDQLFEEYMKSHGENVLPILRAALALKEK